MKFSLLSEIIIWKEKSVSLRYTIGLIVIDIFITTKYPVSLIKYMICYYHIKYKFNNSTIIHILYYCSGSDTLSYFFICKLHFVQDIVFKWPSKIYKKRKKKKRNLKKKKRKKGLLYQILNLPRPPCPVLV